MNDMVKNTLIFTSGLAVGAAGMFFGMKKFIAEACAEKALEMVDEEVERQIEEYKKSLDRRADEMGISKEDADELVSAVTENRKYDDTRKYSSLTQEYDTSAPTEFNYVNAYNKPSPEELDIHRELINNPEVAERLAEEEHPMDDDEEPEDITLDKVLEKEGEIMTEQHQNDVKEHDGPYIIDEDQFANEMRHYSKEDVIYYKPSRTFVFEGDELIDDPAYLFGDTIDRIDEYPEGSGILCRNPRAAADYSIVVVDNTPNDWSNPAGLDPVDWGD